MDYPQNFCRLCAKSFEETYLLNIFKEKTLCNSPLDKIINKYLPFTVTTHDSLPHKVCKMCCANVIKWHRFLTLCVKAQVKLKNKTETDKMSFATRSFETEERRNSGDKIGFTNIKTQDVSNTFITTAETSTFNPVAKKKISNYCIARWCNNGNDAGISLFRIPKDKSRALQWLAAADRMDLADREITYLHRCYMCATHFTREMFVNENCKNINRNAVPSIFPKPVYAEKIEQNLIKASIYPKKLHGIRLKNILPKTMQMSQETSEGSSLPNQVLEHHYIPMIAVVSEPHQDVEQLEIDHKPKSVVFDSNMPTINLPSGCRDPSEIFQGLNVKDPENLPKDQYRVYGLGVDYNSGQPGKTLPSGNDVDEKGNGTKMETIDKEKPKALSPSDTFIFNKFKLNQAEQKNAHVMQDIVCVNSVVNAEEAKEKSSISNNIMDLINSSEHYHDIENVVMIGLDEKLKTTSTIRSSPVEMSLCEDQHEALNNFVLQAVSSENSLSSAISNVPTLPTNKSALLPHDGFNFELKDAPQKVDNLVTLNSAICSQDFLLMHSAIAPVEKTQDLELGQNLNNLCCTIVNEPVPESAVYEDRAMVTDASVRTIECTSPNHGQAIEGLIDLDQFLDSA